MYLNPAMASLRAARSACVASSRHISLAAPRSTAVTGTCFLYNLLGRQYSTRKKRHMKVTIVGAAGRTGEPLALLLKLSPLIDELALYDVVSTCGCGMELGHVDTKCSVKSFSGPSMLCDSLKDASVVVIVAGSGRCDSFETSAPIVTGIAAQICNACPETFTVVATHPIESMVPLVSEIQRLRGVYDARRLLGVTEHQNMRANLLLADFLGITPERVCVPVVAGCTARTMVPVLSGAVYPITMSQEEIECVTSAILCCDGSNSTAMTCSQGACLSGSYAIARVVINVVKGLLGNKEVRQFAYVDTQCCAPNCRFFCNEVLLGPSGVETNYGVPELTAFENCLMTNALPLIQDEISKAEWNVYCMSQELCSCAYAGGCCACSSCAQAYACTTQGCRPCYDPKAMSKVQPNYGYCCCTPPCWRPRDESKPDGCENKQHQTLVLGGQCGKQRLPASVEAMANKKIC